MEEELTNFPLKKREINFITKKFFNRKERKESYLVNVGKSVAERSRSGTLAKYGSLKKNNVLHLKKPKANS